VNVIFDTDMHGDCDDAGALAVLHALATAGEARILACVCSTASYWSVGCIDAINTYYGRPDIPVGAFKGDWYVTRGGYPAAIAGDFPNDAKNLENVPDATELYRRVLAAQPDGTVTVVTVGFLTNLERLLKSGPDEASPLSGPELVRRKVARYVAMAGRFPSGGEYNLNHKGIGPTSKYVIDNWPTPVVFSGFEIGDSIQTGAGLADAPAESPVREAYRIYLGGHGRNRSSWDQTAVLYAVRGLSTYWTSVGGGSCHVFPNGSNEWRATPDRDHEYLVGLMPDAGLARVIEELMLRDPDPGRPAAAFVVTLEGRTARVDASASRDADGRIASCAWSFGDGRSGTGASARHTYRSDGAYTVTLTVTDDEGKTDVERKVAYVGASGLVAHWKLDETSGDLARDSAGAKDGTLRGYAAGGPRWVRARAGCGLSFDGRDDRVEVAADRALGVSSMTLAAWVRIPRALPPGWRTIVEHDRAGANWYGLWKSANADTFHFRWAGSGKCMTDFAAHISPDTWYHVAGTFNAVTGIARTYLDGRLDRTIKGGRGGAPGAASLRIGCNLEGGEAFTGVVDDVRVYNRAISAEEIRALHAAAAGLPK
jgi:PKD repeat protein